jgi:hypothetical protein
MFNLFKNPKGIQSISPGLPSLRGYLGKGIVKPYSTLKKISAKVARTAIFLRNFSTALPDFCKTRLLQRSLKGLRRTAFHAATPLGLLGFFAVNWYDKLEKA